LISFTKLYEISIPLQLSQVSSDLFLGDLSNPSDLGDENEGESCNGFFFFFFYEQK
jgi:hypothetical protein